ncbi:hypothetical protein SprV_0301136400 [Sparganum proliferum]
MHLTTMTSRKKVDYVAEEMVELRADITQMKATMAELLKAIQESRQPAEPRPPSLNLPLCTNEAYRAFLSELEKNAAFAQDALPVSDNRAEQYPLHSPSEDTPPLQPLHRPLWPRHSPLIRRGCEGARGGWCWQGEKELSAADWNGVLFGRPDVDWNTLKGVVTDIMHKNRPPKKGYRVDSPAVAPPVAPPKRGQAPSGPGG